MIILGKSNDDKGTQLEELTKRLLSGYGYKNIITNYIGPGGEEIDVSADYYLPGIGQNQTRRLICECKAYKTPIDITSWLKFLGKIFIEESRRDEEVFGCFIALSGVNGNVAGNYDELFTHRTNVSLVSGEKLTESVTQLFNLTDGNVINQIVSHYTHRIIRMLDICYYDNSVYWIVAFNNDEYTAFGYNGSFLPKEITDKICPILESSNAIGTYVNLEEENQAKQRAIHIQKAILSELMINDGIVNKEQIKIRLQFEDHEIEKALEELLNNNFIYTDNFVVSIYENFDSISIDFYRFFLTGDVFIQALGCDFYDNHINELLISKIQEIQKGLKLSENEVDIVLTLLRFSPTAFASSLYPEEMITTHYEQGITDERIASFDRKYFLKMLYDGLLIDFNNPHLTKYFYEVRGLREIESNHIIKVKGDKETILNDQISNRKGIGQLADEYGGGYIQILVLDDHPEPWEGTPVLTEKMKVNEE
ncbi:hypothetical protein [Paenibacillus sp. sgz500958]|uniref:hypothetical protein n=1 Tax=Paenibacillus sp. sgz500958 TaxID=3242475 RepID=UPI0036D28D12